jgi:DNA modification methylase
MQDERRSRRGRKVKATLYRGDCLDVLAAMEPESVDAIVCDPPYGLGFMGRKWDALPPGEDWARLCLRVLKPGGHLVAFGGTRTVHRLTTAIEDGGFEIRDMVSWLYWSGFPKSLDVSKAIDREAGAEREVVGLSPHYSERRTVDNMSAGGEGGSGQRDRHITAPATEAAKKWDGYGTALKPAQEPAVLARKPLTGTVAATVMEHGTGALNIDGCRFAYGDPAWPGPGDRYQPGTGHASPLSVSLSGGVDGSLNVSMSEPHDLGRWPANIYAHPKASRSEREAGCERLPGRTGAEATDRTAGSAGLDNPRAGAGRTADRVKNHHPTVKPIGVMRWLCKLTGGQPGSVILDPFMGSGTTGCAAVLEGFDFIGIEREPEYMQICEARIRHHMGALFAHGVQVIETDKAAK